MLYMNNFDLSVFSCISKRHTKNLQQRGSTKIIVKQQTRKLWKKFWKNLPYSTIACKFTLTDHAAKEVAKNKESNKLLYSKDIHTVVRVKYENTDKRISMRPSLKHEK